MIFTYIVWGLFSLFSICLILSGIMVFLKRMQAEKCFAVIADVQGNGRRHGIVKVFYDVMVDGRVVRSNGVSVMLFNPIYLLSPQLLIGKQVFVKYNRLRNRVLPHPSVTIFYFCIGILCSILSIFILHLLLSFH